MVDDTKQYQEEEYVFSDNEQSETSDSNESPVQNVDSSFSVKDSMLNTWRKNLIIGVGLLVVVFLVYKIVSFFFHSGDVNQMSKIPAAIQITPVSKPMSLTKENIENSSLHQAVESYHQDHLKDQRLTQLEQSSQNVSTEIESLQTANQNLQSSVDAINTQLSQLNTTLAVLADKLQTQENALSKSQQKKKSKVFARPKVVVDQETYTVSAIVPGRAWLKASNGSTVTVSNGTVLPGYGTVTKIDPQLGLITTSSGVVIQYASNDE